MLTETTMLCGPAGNLVATITLPAGAADARGLPVALLTNSGVISRVGPHRINVRLARHLAQRGTASIRFDLSGIGDSRRAGSASSQMEQWVADTRAIMDQLGAQLRSDRFFMVGFCSGAEVAYRTALEDPRLRAVLLWDLYAYQTARSRLNTFVFKLRRAGVSGVARKGLAVLLRVLGRSPQVQAKRQLQDLEPARIPAVGEFAASLGTLMGRGTDVFVVFCGGEPEWYNYPGQFHDSMSAFPDIRKVRCEQLMLSDHLLTRSESRAAFVGLVDDWLARNHLLPASP